MSNSPLVSVIIPTHRRPELVLRAARCALAQSLGDIEVIVVIDGPDEETASALNTIPDPRLRVVTLPANSGVSVARNRGAEEARAEWVAWLDDDDEWLPGKLEAQLRAAKQSVWPFPIVLSRFYARSRHGELLWPRRLPSAQERIDEYLFCQHNLFGGEGMLLLTTAFVRRELAKRVPFQPALRRHQDIEWLLEATQVEGCAVEFVPAEQPLAVWNMDDSRARISTTADWRESLAWARANRHRLSRRAVAGFLLTWASSAAARQRRWSAFLQLPAEAFRLGRPHMVDLSAHVLIWMIPAAMRARISALLQKRNHE